MISRFHQVSPEVTNRACTTPSKKILKKSKNTLECLQESFAFWYLLIFQDISSFHLSKQKPWYLLDTLSQLHPVTLIGGWLRSPLDTATMSPCEAVKSCCPTQRSCSRHRLPAVQSTHPNGGFHSHGATPLSLDGLGKSYWNGWFRGTPIYDIYGNLQIDWCQFLGRAASSYAHSLYRLIMFDSLHSRQPSKLPHLNAAQALGHKEQAAPNLSQCARQKTSLILQPENPVCPKKTRHDTSHRKTNRRCQSLQLFWIQVGWRNPLWQHLESHVGSFVHSYILQNVFGTLQPNSFWITKAWNKSRSTSAMRRNAKKMSTVWSCSAGHDWLCSTLRSWLWSHLGSLHPLRWLRWLHWLYCFPLHCEFRGFAAEWPTFPTQSWRHLRNSAKFCESEQ